MLVLAKLTVSATPRRFRGPRPLDKTANPLGEHELEPSRGSFRGTRMPHHHPEAGMTRNHQVSANANQPGGARSHGFKPSRWTSTPPTSPSPLPSPSLLPRFIPPRVQSHREAWRPTPPAGCACGPQTPRGAVSVAHPRLERVAQPPVLQTQPEFGRTRAVWQEGPSPPFGAPWFRISKGTPHPKPRGAQPFAQPPRLPLLGAPGAQALTSQSPRFSPYSGTSRPPNLHSPTPGTRHPKVPAVKMQRAKRVLQIMVSRCWVPTRARATGEFVGTDRAHREPTAPPLPGGLVVGARGRGGTGGGRGSQANAARLRSVSCVSCGARRASAPSQRLEPGAASAAAPAAPNPSHPGRRRPQGHPLAFPLPALRPGSPA